MTLQTELHVGGPLKSLSVYNEMLTAGALTLLPVSVLYHLT